MRASATDVVTLIRVASTPTAAGTISRTPPLPMAPSMTRLTASEAEVPSGEVPVPRKPSIILEISPPVIPVLPSEPWEKSSSTR